MQGRAPVILLEFNELTPSLMDRFSAQGKLPNFSALRNRSQVYTSHADEEAPFLEPWIQWVNVHTGLNYAEHGIFSLSEGHKLRQKAIWDLASDEGLSVWICASMNMRYEPAIKGYMLPDPWATDVTPHPEALQPYFRFVQQNVLEYTRDRVPLTRSDYRKFLTFMVQHGISLHTVRTIVRQLTSEKTSGMGRWRRAFILDELQFDLFAAIYRRLRPSLSTFFLNSTAHMQHMYWRDMEPELFKVPPSDPSGQYSSSILLGYQKMDQLLGRMLKLVGNDAIVILATALSQQPCVVYEDAGGKHGYRPKDFATLMAFAGVSCPYRVAPVMAEQFWLHANSDVEAREIESKLSALKVGDKRGMETRRDGNAVFVACPIKKALDRTAVLEISGTDSRTPFFEMFYEVEGRKSGMHHPDGILWIRDPRRLPCVHDEKVPLTSIAPTILELLGVRQPEYMRDISLFSRVPESPALRATG